MPSSMPPTAPTLPDDREESGAVISSDERHRVPANAGTQGDERHRSPTRAHVRARWGKAKALLFTVIPASRCLPTTLSSG
jgi:hypothetical protein